MCSPSSACRRATRAAGSATSSTRTSASGATTVVMSRPSATMPPLGAGDQVPLPRDQVCADVQVGRDRADRGRDLGARIAAVTSAPSIAIRGVPGRARSRTSRRGTSADDGVGVGAVDAARRAPARSRAIHRSRVEVVQPEPGGDPARRARLARTARSVDRHDQCARRTRRRVGDRLSVDPRCLRHVVQPTGRRRQRRRFRERRRVAGVPPRNSGTTAGGGAQETSSRGRAWSRRAARPGPGPPRARDSRPHAPGRARSRCPRR